jgi:hypothetical protein
MIRHNLYLLSLAGLFCLGLSSCDRGPAGGKVAGAQTIPDSEKPVLSFQDTLYRFGTIKEGEEVSHDFPFTNNGKSDLLISTASASCGCTVPEWPKEPIPPGGKGIIKATFNSEGKQGKQSKKIVITANTKPELTEIWLEGDVIPKPSTANP